VAGIGALVIVLLAIGAILTVNLPKGKSNTQGQAKPTPKSATTTQATQPSTQEKTSSMTTPKPPSVSPDASPDPAFDLLLPTLKKMTDAPIMLPANLPEELKYVAVDSGTSGDKYSVFFLNVANKTGEVTQEFVGAAVRGDISAEPSGPGPQFPDYGPGVKQTSLGKVTLPDGTEATLNYYDPETNVPFTAGSFVYQDPSAGRNYLYTVEIDRDSSQGDLIKQVLSTMVSVPDTVEATSVEPTTPESTTSSEGPTTGDFLQQFVSNYYDAVSRKDWTATYSMLDDVSKQKFTEDEWIKIQGVRAASNSSPIVSATAEGPYGSETQYPFSMNVKLTYEDGTSETTKMGLVSAPTVNDVSDYHRHLTDKDISYLKGLIH